MIQERNIKEEAYGIFGPTPREISTWTKGEVVKKIKEATKRLEKFDANIISILRKIKKANKLVDIDEASHHIARWMNYGMPDNLCKQRGLLSELSSDLGAIFRLDDFEMDEVPEDMMKLDEEIRCSARTNAQIVFLMALNKTLY